MNNETQKLILGIITACENVHLSTFGMHDYPDTRHIMNGMNRNATDLNLYFMTNDRSIKYQQILKNPNCCLYYFNMENRHAIRLFGRIEIIQNKDEKIAHWHDDYKKFGYIGADDAHYALLHFVPHEYKFYVGPELNSGKI